jgi:hypothetical protein
MLNKTFMVHENDPLINPRDGSFLPQIKTKENMILIQVNSDLILI